MSQQAEQPKQVAFYPGAGLDVAPFILFPEIADWYCMDSQPWSEFGAKPGYERPHFLARLDQVMGQIGMKKIEQPPDTNTDIVVFESEQQRVTYFINSVFPDALVRVPPACNVLVACGFSLTDKAPDFLAKWPHIICNNRTHYADWVTEWKPEKISIIEWIDEDDIVLEIKNWTREFVQPRTRVVECLTP